MSTDRQRRSTGPSVPNWLTPAQLSAWQAVHVMLLLLPAALDRQLQRDSKLSLIEYYALAFLSGSAGHAMRISELAVLTNAELSRVSHLVTRLEKRGYVRREPDPNDGRFTNAILTDDGYQCLAEAAPGHVAMVRELVIDALDEEALRVLERSAQTITERISATDLGLCQPTKPNKSRAERN